MQTGRWLSLRSENQSSSVADNVDNAVNERDVMDFRFTPSGRYGFLLRDQPASAVHGEPTHYYELFFSVIDTFRRTLTQYKSIDTTFRTYHRFYVLDENVGVLLDFSRHHCMVTQHLIYFDHDRAQVRCELSRRWSFGVDEMLAGTDGTYVPGTSQLLHIDSERYVPLLGQLDRLLGYVVMRVVPADPRCVSDASRRHSARLFLFNPSSLCGCAYTRMRGPSGAELRVGRRGSSVVSTEERRVSGATTDYPFIHKSGIFFFVSRSVDGASSSSSEPSANHVDINDDEQATPLSLCIRWMLEIDVAGLLATPSPDLPSSSAAGRRLSFSISLRRIQLSTRRNQIVEVVDTSPTAGTNGDENEEPMVAGADRERLTTARDQRSAIPSVNPNAVVELVQKGAPFISMRLIDVSRMEVVGERDVIEMYTYIQAGSNVYVRVQFRAPSRSIFGIIRSKWICLDLTTWQWKPFFRQPCRARIPFWFCGIPDGRAFFYRQVWQRGTTEIIGRQFRVMMPPRSVLPLRKLAFLDYGCAKHASLAVEETARKPDDISRNKQGCSIGGNSMARRSAGAERRRSRTADESNRSRLRHSRSKLDALLAKYIRVFQLFGSF